MILGVRTDIRGGRGPARPSTAVRVFHLGRTVRGSPYYPALSHPVLRRVLPGAAASALGDGMSAVAIAWLALKLAPEPSPPDALAQVIAARSSLLIVASPVGTALGGPLVAALGARGTLLASALATIALALVTAAILIWRRARVTVRSAEPATSGG
jgi:MFS transporter, DHA3 family, macrolide efflux protein